MTATSKTAQAIPKKIPTESAKQRDAIAVLTQDHEHVKALFEQYEALSDRSPAKKKKLAHEICLELTRHATAEEEIFYPAVREANGDNEDLIDEATVEHASAKELIAQILAMEPADELYDAKVKVLSEQIEHHVKEEEGEMFPKAKKAKLDLAALGQAIEARKEEVELPSVQ
ncbi:hemerythrin superfamily protein [Janthinobacterium sp. CG_23.3]|uniref:hemerythrin domain-containing protein n=1 Tax=unclassified Janthinobacterium TaxID=2610881 RepID=UPI0003479D8A|nr:MULTISPECIES: hemerythrin domain-containing protein [unclassified Janthinobacterium]MEC5161486.1 hemerythrin superfamily protein [Janthinobacterium sp. CG_S6]